MSEQDPKGAAPENKGWQHDQDLSFKKVLPNLEMLKEAVEKALRAERVKLEQMVGAKDTFRKK